MDIFRAYEAQIDDVVPGERMVVARINTGAVDSYRTVIDPMGGDLSEFKACPTVLWEHGKDPTRGRVPIGKCVGIQAVKARNGSIVARTQFAKDDYSMLLFDMYRDETLRGWSIFALPNESKSGPPTRAEIRARPDLEDCECVYRAWKLKEYSGVAVPGNPETLTLMAERGIWYPEERGITQAGGGVVAHGASGAEADPEAESQGTEPDADDEGESRFIKKVGSEWGVYSEDGKLLGKHGTREEAAKQLAAIEAHKHDAGRAAPELPTAPGRLYQDIHSELLGEFRSMRSEILAHVRDFAALMRGRV